PSNWIDSSRPEGSTMHSHALAKWNFVGNIVLSLTLATLLLGGFKSQQPAVLSVERLNIVASAGHLALVISSAARLPGVMLSGVEHGRPRGRVGSAGMLFFNEAGDEVGGLIYKGGPGAPTDSNRAFGHLSLDQWKSNQVVVLQYLDNGTNRSAGLRIWDRPTGKRAELLPVLERQMNASPRGPVRDSLIREYVRLEGSLRAGCLQGVRILGSTSHARGLAGMHSFAAPGPAAAPRACRLADPICGVPRTGSCRCPGIAARRPDSISTDPMTDARR